MDRYLKNFGFPVIDYYDKVFDLKETPFKQLSKRFIELYQQQV